MKKEINVSTPSRICLFGEHQDYLGLEVIASAINLRFYASINSRRDNIIRVVTSGEKYGKLSNLESEYNQKETIIDLSKTIEYENNRDYLKSSVNVLIKNGYKFQHGYDVVLNSEIPMGKGMSSSTTMIIVFIKALLEAINAEDKDNDEKIVQLGFEAEVLEFKEPGGMMDHYASALGGLVHLNFEKKETKIEKMETVLPGCFILFDSKAQKDTTRVLANAKNPVVDGLNKLKEYGIESIRDFIADENNIEHLDNLTEEERKKIIANIDNYKIVKQAIELLKPGNFDPIVFGELLKRHHANLRDGLNISTTAVEEILETAYKNGALGGKINGSGGGGCAYVYAHEEDSKRIQEAVEALGYRGCIIRQDTGVRKDGEDIIA